MGKHTPAAEQRRLVALWREADTSIAAFARAHGVQPVTFGSWVERHAPQPPPPRFLPVAVVPAEVTPQAFTVRVGAHHLQFDLPPPPMWFAQLLRALDPC